MSTAIGRRAVILGALAAVASHAGPGLPPGANAHQMAQLRTIIADPQQRYVLVTRPSDTQRFQVDLVQIDPITRKPATRLPTPLSCSRLHASTSGKVFCLSGLVPGTGQRTGDAAGYVFDRSFALQKANEPRAGIVSRARISSDGKYTASTSFVTGHSYMSGPGQFSTASFIGQADGKAPEQDIQTWQVLRDGKVFNPLDLNLWGVTFNPKDSNQFFVTAQSKGIAHLARGNVEKRRIEITSLEVECPSFSPDGKRIAFKKRTGAARWVPAVLDLETDKVTGFDSVPDSVDDQIEWLDNTTLIFEVTTVPLLGKARTDLMTLDIQRMDSMPQRWLGDARSPTFVGAR
ncbi:MAG: hypothetical protein KKC79_16280 [Gammaproteobacteria bacterium]|nr:hypothetical protein [Gammaproteobacteria bacterium]MBU1443462.1 hypothetical protein [Gammaproteobacteria bacterium]MBU2288910.1 hypothetical protein [Gammaproteobacteria bacterium]MBU2410193.1 hypothetical protein [Gammaproteobacteria bacterium]